MEQELEWNYIIKGKDFTAYACFENEYTYDWFLIVDFSEKKFEEFEIREYEQGTPMRRKQLKKLIENSKYGNEKVVIQKIYKTDNAFNLHKTLAGYLI